MVSALEAAQMRRRQREGVPSASAESKQWRPKMGIGGEQGQGAMSALEKAMQCRRDLQQVKQSEPPRAPAGESGATGMPRY